jgi:hypothetical protein
LPSGYRGGRTRYPVILCLHGLPAGPNAYMTNPWVAQTLGFYVGQQDSRFLEDNVELARALSRQRVADRFATDPGGHSGALWISLAPS